MSSTKIDNFVSDKINLENREIYSKKIVREYTSDDFISIESGKNFTPYKKEKKYTTLKDYFKHLEEIDEMFPCNDFHVKGDSHTEMYDIMSYECDNENGCDGYDYMCSCGRGKHYIP